MTLGVTISDDEEPFCCEVHVSHRLRLHVIGSEGARTICNPGQTRSTGLLVQLRKPSLEQLSKRKEEKEKEKVQTKRALWMRLCRQRRTDVDVIVKAKREGRGVIYQPPDWG